VSVVAGAVQEDDCEELIEASARLDSEYGHLCDWTLVNDELDLAVTELCQLARAVQTEPNWVPVSWIS